MQIIKNTYGKFTACAHVKFITLRKSLELIKKVVTLLSQTFHTI